MKIHLAAIALGLCGSAWGQARFSGTVVSVVQGGVKIRTAQGQQLVVPRTMRFTQGNREQWFGNLKPGAQVSVEAPSRRRELVVSAESNPHKLAASGNAAWLGYYLPSTEYVYVPINSAEAYLDNNYNNPYSYVYQNSRQGNLSPPPQSQPNGSAPASAPQISVPAPVPAAATPSAPPPPPALTTLTPVATPAAPAPVTSSLTRVTSTTSSLTRTSTGLVNTTTAPVPSTITQTTSTLTNTSGRTVTSLTGTASGLLNSTTQTVLSLPGGLLGHP